MTIRIGPNPPEQGGDAPKNLGHSSQTKKIASWGIKMLYHPIFKVVLAIGLTSSLSGCLGSNGSGGAAGGTAAGASDFETAYDAANGLGPTQDMPTAINATYAGQFKAGVNSGSAAGFNENVEILGDLNLAVNWTDGQTTNPFSGGAKNIVVTDVTNGASETLIGELSVLPDTGSISRVNIPASTVGGFAIPELNTGAFSFEVGGQVSGSEGAVDARVLVGGNFHGPAGESMVGVVSGGLKEVGSTNPAIFDAGIGGAAYLNKQ